ncbi:hypothetical protein [Streptomyces xantholiticus]|uniref:CBM-cenC domain-containing protein n=1 Tax=Streptomyces xantholiticus TaxID=68285 RepID=A0ABV1UZP8_9ACTN
MANFLDTQVDARRWAELLAEYDRRLQALERTAKASHTSIEGGALDIYDEEGTLKGSVGIQPDGAVAVVPVNSAPPPTPTAPLVEPVLAGLVIGWDGLWDDSYTPPSDFSLVQVHVGAAADFTPDLSTLVATITAPLGGAVTVAIEGYGTVWVRLVAANTAAVTGPASVATAGTPRQAVSQDLIDGIVTETKLAASAVTQAKIALGAVGSTALAAGAVLEEKLAKAAVTLDKIANGAVHLNAIGGALADGVTQRWVDAMADPAAWSVLTKAAGATWEHLTGITDAPTGRSVARATGYTVVRGVVQVPYDPEALYRISARVRTTVASASGTDTLYVGALGVAADGVTLVSRSGANAYSSAHYVGASNAPLPAGSGWVTYIGYLRGRAASGTNGTAAAAPDPRSPGVMHANVRFIAPILYLNFGSGATGTTGVMEVDAFTIEVLKTGVVDSTNLVVGSVTTAALATDAVTAGKVAADAISAREIQTNSITALELAAGSVNVDKLTIAGGSNVLSDPSFEGAYTAAIVEKYAYATQDKGFGNGSSASLKIDSTAGTATYRSVELTLLPTTAGDQVYIATDYYAPAAWSGSEIDMQVRWEKQDGTVLSYGKASTTTPIRDAWARLSATVTAPAGACLGRVRVEAYGTAGAVWWDNAACRPVVPGVQIADGAITAPKILAGAVTTTKLDALAVTAEKIAALAITTAKLDALAVTADKLAANSVTATKILAGTIDSTHIKAGSISTDRLTVTGGTNLLSDPSFEGPASDALVAGNPYWSIDASKGNGSARSLKVDTTAASPTNRTLTIASFPVIPGDQLYLAFDYQASADYNGSRVRLYVRWHDAGNATLGYTIAESQTPVLGETWQRHEATGAAPATAVRAEIVALGYLASQGTVWFDNAVVRPVIGATEIRDGAITAEKIKADAIDGKVITGATVQTAKSGARVVLDTVMRLYNSNGELLAEAVPNAAALGYPNDAGFIVYNTVGFGRYWAQLSRGFIRFGKDGSTYRWPALIDHYLSGGSTSVLKLESGVLEGAEEEAQATLSLLGTSTGVNGDHPRVFIGGSGMRNDGRADLEVTGALNVGSIAKGRTGITPSAANTPTSVTITGLGLVGPNPRAVATASTTVPGTQVTGVACTHITNDSFVLWLTRTNTTATAIDWIVMSGDE